MKAFNLSAAAGLERNSSLLLSHLVSLSVAGPVGKPNNPLHIHLRVDNGRRDTLLQHVRALYDVALKHHPETFISVIPISPFENNESTFTGKNNEDSTKLSLFTSSFMTADRGFDPLYMHVALGGTFDRLHGGHKLLLTTAMFYTKKTLHIGVTREEMLTKKVHGAYIEPFELRCAAVSNFLHLLRNDIELNVVGITEPSGGTDRDASVEALVVSPETASALTTINAKRALNGLPPMQSIQIPYVDANGTIRISSTELRRRLSDNLRDAN